MRLKHNADLLSEAIESCIGTSKQILSKHLKTALLQAAQTTNQGEQRCFATTGRADQSYEFSMAYSKGYALENLMPVGGIRERMRYINCVNCILIVDGRHTLSKQVGWIGILELQHSQQSGGAAHGKNKQKCIDKNRWGYLHWQTCE